MKTMLRFAVSLGVVFGALLMAREASAGAQLQYVWSGNSGQTFVFIHGKADCSTGMSDCNSYDSTTGPVGYWTNSANNYDMLNEATTKYVSGSSTPQYAEAFVIGHDTDNQGYWSSATDVGACLQDFYQGTNNSGCNPNGYQRSSFHIVTHSAGATIIDRLLSTGWYGISPHVVGNVITLAPALAGSRASSALYNVDGYGGGFCTTLVRWLAGWSFKNNGANSLTRGNVIGQANQGYQGRSPIWFLKATTTGGGGSANNNSSVGVNEHDNDGYMGTLIGCLGYNSSDDADGLLYWSDSDPTNNTGANGCNTSDTAYGGVNSCHYYSQYSGAYWHWFTSWANHSHSRDDAYTTLGDWQSTNGCYTRSPGTCVGQYGW